MSSVIDRGHEVARELYTGHVARNSPLRGHEDALLKLMAEAFAHGAMWGIERTEHAVAITHARYATEIAEQVPR